MTKSEMQKVMTYIFADFDAEVRPEKRAVWFDQFGHFEFHTAMVAAKVLMSKKHYGLPRAHDFALAIDDVMSSLHDRIQWGEAWDLWVRLAEQYGANQQIELMKQYMAKCPRGAQVIRTGVREYFYGDMKDDSTRAAQFRQRYEALESRDRADRLLNPQLQFTRTAINFMGNDETSFAQTKENTSTPTKYAKAS